MAVEIDGNEDAISKAPLTAPKDTVKTKEFTTKISSKAQIKPATELLQKQVSSRKRKCCSKQELVKAIRGMPLHAKKYKLNKMTKGLSKQKRETWCNEILEEFRVSDTEDSAKNSHEEDMKIIFHDVKGSDSSDTKGKFKSS